MKTIFANLRDTIIAGIIFLLPLLLIMVLISKTFGFLKGLTTKAAAFFGVSTLAGVSGSTVVGGISILLLCLICGYLVRFTFFSSISTWVDQKLMDLIPGYKIYREMALNKLVDNEKPLPYESAAWLKNDEKTKQPVFLMQILKDGQYVIFVPTAGNLDEGNILKVDPSIVEIDRTIDLKSFKMLFTNLGLGMDDLKKA